MTIRAPGREFPAAALSIALLLAPMAGLAQQAESGVGRSFGAGYASLSAAQKTSIDDIYRRFGAIVGREVDPEQAYNGTRLSVRTTSPSPTSTGTPTTAWRSGWRRPPLQSQLRAGAPRPAPAVRDPGDSHAAGRGDEVRQLQEVRRPAQVRQRRLGDDEIEYFLSSFS